MVIQAIDVRLSTFALRQRSKFVELMSCHRESVSCIAQPNTSSLHIALGTLARSDQFTCRFDLGCTAVGDQSD